MTTFYVDQDVAVTATLTNLAGTAANPDLVRFRTKDPSGTETSYIVGTDSEATEVTSGNVYRLVFDAASAGRWYIRCEGELSSVIVGASEIVVDVAASNFS